MTVTTNEKALAAPPASGACGDTPSVGASLGQMRGSATVDEVGKAPSGQTFVCVEVTVTRARRPIHLWMVAPSIGLAVEAASRLDDTGRARLVLPIDPERFFVNGANGVGAGRRCIATTTRVR